MEGLKVDRQSMQVTLLWHYMFKEAEPRKEYYCPILQPLKLLRHLLEFTGDGKYHQVIASLW